MFNVTLESCCDSPDNFFCYGNPIKEIAIFVCQGCGNTQVFTNNGVTFSEYPEKNGKKKINKLDNPEEYQ